jgi:hypothetical protein
MQQRAGVAIALLVLLRSKRALGAVVDRRSAGAKQ